MSAYAYYKADMYDEAIAALDRYIELHPASPEVPYAYYLKGLLLRTDLRHPSRSGNDAVGKEGLR